MAMTDVSSQSRLKMFNDCNYKHWLTYILEEDTPEPMDAALSYGTALHLAMAEYGRARMKGLTHELAKVSGINSIAATWFEADRIDPQEAFLATVEVVKDYEFLAVELEIVMELGPHEYQLKGAIDAIVKDDQGRTHILDYKFLKSDQTRYQFDIQACTYTALARSIDYKPASFVFIQTIKSGMDIDLGESEFEYQNRLLTACLKNKSGKSNLVRRNPEHVSDYKSRVQAHYRNKPPSLWVIEPTEMQIEECLEAHRMALDVGGFMKGRNPESCFKYGRRCEFLNKCNGNSMDLV